MISAGIGFSISGIPKDSITSLEFANTADFPSSMGMLIDKVVLLLGSECILAPLSLIFDDAWKLLLLKIFVMTAIFAIVTPAPCIFVLFINWSFCEKKNPLYLESNNKNVRCNSFTIPMVLVLLLLFTETKSNGLIKTPGFIITQKESMVLENFSDTKVFPI